MSPTSDNSWGADRLGSNEIIPSGGSFSIQNVSCDSYDIRLLDEDMDECVVNDVELCGENAVFELTNNNLLSCQGYGQ